MRWRLKRSISIQSWIWLSGRLSRPFGGLGKTIFLIVFPQILILTDFSFRNPAASYPARVCLIGKPGGFLFAKKGAPCYSLRVMVSLRLQRIGRKREPVFRLVAIDSHRAAQSGRVLEVLGSRDARRGRPTLKAERVRYWLSVGARPSVTVHNFLVDAKIMTGPKINALPSRQAKVVDATTGGEKTETKTPTAEAAAPEPAAV